MKDSNWLTISDSLKLTKLAILVIAVFVAYSAPAQSTGISRSAAGSTTQRGEQSPAPASGQSTPAVPSQAGTESMPENPTPQNPTSEPFKSGDPVVPPTLDTAAEQLKLEEKQRVLGVAPIFNVTYLGDKTAPLSTGQKFNLAFHSSVDPFVLFAATFDAGISQAENNFSGYGQGWNGYGKRVGASYADAVDATILGNAVLPALLHEDPRYFRKGTGTFTQRLLYSMSTTVWSKRDNGKWGPNYANVLGNLAAGGISNLYYPSTDTGVGLTFGRAFTVTAEGAIGGVFEEFWPDISRKFFNKHTGQLQLQPPPATPSGSASPK